MLSRVRYALVLGAAFGAATATAQAATAASPQLESTRAEMSLTSAVVTGSDGGWLADLLHRAGVRRPAQPGGPKPA